MIMPTNVQIVEARFGRAERPGRFIKCTACWLLRRTRVPGHSTKKRDLETPCLGPSDSADNLPKGASLFGRPLWKVVRLWHITEDLGGDVRNSVF